MFPTFSTSTAQEQITEKWDQIVPAQGVAAFLTMTTFFRDTLSGGEAIDADIQEAAYHDAKEKDPNSDNYHDSCFRSDHRGNASNVLIHPGNISVAGV
jgi:hypothetical protein